MKIIIVNNYEEMSYEAYKIVKDEMLKKNNLCLGLATGSTPIGLYNCLIDGYKKKEISFKNVKTFNLDEYVSLDGQHEQSYAYFMRKHLFDHIDIAHDNINFLSGVSENLELECQRYNNLLSSNEIDIQLLGVGSNGHIAFNEPYTSFSSTTHVVNLSANTIKDNSRFFNNINDVPKKALTMGISNILKAKKIIILASGHNKAQAIYSFFQGKYDESLPISALKTHEDVTLIIDLDAASLIYKKI